MKTKKIELLSPAKDVEVGMAAINHGADAVYIGGPDFGAREKASNSIQDIERLCRHAALFDAKVYVTLNTLLYERELERASKMAYDCWNAGVDALIVQDMQLLNLDLPPIPLHASTQCDNLNWSFSCMAHSASATAGGAISASISVTAAPIVVPVPSLVDCLGTCSMRTGKC